MAQFSVNTHRFDPYKNFRFHVYWSGSTEPVAGVSKISALKQSTEPVEHRQGGDPITTHKTPSKITFDDITLERGLTHDPAFENWAKLVWNNELTGISLKNFRKNIRIVLLNEQGTPVMAFDVYRCWVKEYTALPELDAGGNAVAIESMVLAHEGWERDMTVTEPDET